MSGPKGTTTHALSLVPVIHSSSSSARGARALSLADSQGVLSDSASVKQFMGYSGLGCQSAAVVGLSDCFLFSFEQ